MSATQSRPKDVHTENITKLIKSFDKCILSGKNGYLTHLCTLVGNLHNFTRSRCFYNTTFGDGTNQNNMAQYVHSPKTTWCCYIGNMRNFFFWNCISCNSYARLMTTQWQDIFVQILFAYKSKKFIFIPFIFEKAREVSSLQSSIYCWNAKMHTLDFRRLIFEGGHRSI